MGTMSAVVSLSVHLPRCVGGCDWLCSTTQVVHQIHLQRNATTGSDGFVPIKVCKGEGKDSVAGHGRNRGSHGII